MLQSNKVLLTIFILALVAILSTDAIDDCFYPTGVDSRWKRRCKRRQFVSSLDSTYQGKYGDRIWKVCCRDLPLLSELPAEPEMSTIRCSIWTGYVNTYGGVLDFVCPGTGFIAGIRSRHSNEREDRVYRFKCCFADGYIMQNCKTSGIVNAFNKRVMYTVEEGRVLNGMGAIFRDHYKDRLFEFQDCLMKKIV